jgi:hypothetical protein
VIVMATIEAQVMAIAATTAAGAIRMSCLSLVWTGLRDGWRRSVAHQPRRDTAAARDTPTVLPPVDDRAHLDAGTALAGLVSTLRS